MVNVMVRVSVGVMIMVSTLLRSTVTPRVTLMLP